MVEGGGSGAGRKKLCEGVGEATIDIANSLFFRVALPALRVPVPIIVSDVAVGFAYALATLHGLHRAGVQ